jgi:Xaa-Pro aminopeptidase
VRLCELSSSIPEGVDGLLIKKECNLKYFTGFSCDAGLLLVSREGSVFFTDSRYTEAAEKTISGCGVENSARLPEHIKEYCKKFKIKTLAGESSAMTVACAERYGSMLGDDVSLVFGGTADDIINGMRAVKTPAEVGLIKKAQAVAERSFEYIMGIIRPGMTEREVKTELDYFMLKNGAEKISFDTIAVSGANSSMPHGVPSDKALKEGDMLTLDFGAVCGGYHSDMTRTVAVSRCGEEQKEVYSIVLAAQEAALKALRPGVPCRYADRAARDLIAAAGYGERFGHGTGHGVGLELHENPTLNPRSEEILKKGNVVTVEPGIYIPGRFGVRIEDMVLITDGGYENLTRSPKELCTAGNR